MASTPDISLIKHRGVSFSPAVRVVPTRHWNDYTAEELRACWYQGAEYKQFRHEIKKTVVLIKNHIAINEYESSARGIECFTQEGARQKRLNKLKGWHAVFDEQDQQYHAEIVDPVMLALAYRQSSQECQHAASHMGLCDEREVEKSRRSSTRKCNVNPKKFILSDPFAVSSIRSPRSVQAVALLSSSPAA